MNQKSITDLDAVQSLAHDLKGPLSSACSWVDMIQHQGALNEVQMHSLERALQALERATDMVKNMLALTQLDGDLARSAVDLGGLLKESIELFQPQIQQRRIEVTCRMPDAPVVIHADEVLIRRVVDNLLHNAIKFNREGGRVRITVSDHGAMVRVDVKDNGPGIPIEEQLFVFERFYRGVDHRRAKDRGSGMGLAICKVIVEQHDGQIWLESELGRGSTFSFELPLAGDHRVALNRDSVAGDLMRGDEASESADGVDDNQQESSEFHDAESRHDEV